MKHCKNLKKAYSYKYYVILSTFLHIFLIVFDF